MRVLLIDGPDFGGGACVMSKRLLQASLSISNRMQYIYISPKKNQLNEWCIINNVENYVLPYKNCVYRPFKSRFLNSIKRLYKLVIVTSFNWFAYRKICKMGILRSVDLIHSNINRDLFGQILSKKFGIPCISSIREYSRAHFQLELLYKRQLAFMNQNTYKFVAVSDVVKNDWISYGLDVNKIITIYDGVPTVDYLSRSHQINHEGLKIVMCGYVDKGKGQLELLKAVQPLINAGLIISVDFYGYINDVKYFEELKRFIRDNNLSESVVFKGYADNLFELLSQYDVGIICSKAEGFGLVTIEYLLSGLVVIASNTGANSELLQNGKYGLIYKFGDIDDLKNNIKNVYYKNGFGQIVCREKRVEYAYHTFSIDNTMKSFLNLYLESCRK